MKDHQDPHSKHKDEQGRYIVRRQGQGMTAAAAAAMFGSVPDFGLTVRRDKPHIDENPPPAKNRPCPCGSGRKYKKCCGKR